MTTDVDVDRPSQLSELAGQAIAATRRLGEQTAFYGSALAATGDAVRRYPGEVLRLIAVMGMGTGASPSSAAPWSSSGSSPCPPAR